MDEQEEFVRWWKENVRKAGQGNNAGPRYLSVADAEEKTGITQQQVSKWKARLADREAYRAALFGVTFAFHHATKFL